MGQHFLRDFNLFHSLGDSDSEEQLIEALDSRRLCLSTNKQSAALERPPKKKGGRNPVSISRQIVIM